MSATKKKRKKLGDCEDCGRNTYEIGEYYMVRNSVWDETGLKHGKGMLCIKDLEKRIGRKLNFEDFTLCRLNASNLILIGRVSRLLMKRMDLVP